MLDDRFIRWTTNAATVSLHIHVLCRSGDVCLQSIASLNPDILNSVNRRKRRKMWMEIPGFNQTHNSSHFQCAFEHSLLVVAAIVVDVIWLFRWADNYWFTYVCTTSHYSVGQNIALTTLHHWRIRLSALTDRPFHNDRRNSVPCVVHVNVRMEIPSFDKAEKIRHVHSAVL